MSNQFITIKGTQFFNIFAICVIVNTYIFSSNSLVFEIVLKQNRILYPLFFHAQRVVAHAGGFMFNPPVEVIPVIFLALSLAYSSGRDIARVILAKNRLSSRILRYP